MVLPRPLATADALGHSERLPVVTNLATMGTMRTAALRSIAVLQANSAYALQRTRLVGPAVRWPYVQKPIYRGKGDDEFFSHVGDIQFNHDAFPSGHDQKGSSTAWE